MLPGPISTRILVVLLAAVALPLPAPATAASECDGKAPTIVGTEGEDHIVGTPFDDVIDAGGGDDRIEAGAGNDTICAGRGGDVVEAGDGGDLVDPGVEISGQDEDGLPDEIDGGAGRDTLVYASAPLPVAVLLSIGQASTVALAEDGFNPVGGDSLEGIENAIGTDIATQPQGDVFEGTGGKNSFIGFGGNDSMHGGGGDDYLDGGAGTDIVSFERSLRGVRVDLGGGYATGQGADELASIEAVVGSPRNDVVVGDEHGNFIDGGAGADRLRGAGGDDSFIPDPYYERASDDVVNGGPGERDLVFLQTGSERGVVIDLVAGTVTGHGRDVVSGVEDILATGNDDVFRGGPGDDTFNAGGGNDVVTGRRGDDRLEGGPGNDSLDGGPGLDTLSYFGDPDGVQVRIDLGTSTGDGHDTFERFEWVWGSHGNDEIRGGPFEDVVSGIEGDDVLYGGGGNDLLDGNEGHDVVHGDEGHDGCSGEETFTCEEPLDGG